MNTRTHTATTPCKGLGFWMVRSVNTGIHQRSCRPPPSGLSWWFREIPKGDEQKHKLRFRICKLLCFATFFLIKDDLNSHDFLLYTVLSCTCLNKSDPNMEFLSPHTPKVQPSTRWNKFPTSSARLSTLKFWSRCVWARWTMTTPRTLEPPNSQARNAKIPDRAT